MNSRTHRLRLWHDPLWWFVLGSCALLAWLCFPGCATAPAKHGIPKLALISPGLYRGGQPTAEGWSYLSSLGISNVVKLNTEAEDSDQAARTFGMCVMGFPISLSQQMFGPVGPQLDGAVANMVPGTFVHCEHGANRTGAAVILYRVRHAWTVGAAEREADKYGWRSSLPALKRFVEGLRAIVGAPGVRTNAVPAPKEAARQARVTLRWDNVASGNAARFYTVVEATTNFQGWQEVARLPYLVAGELVLTDRPPYEFYRVGNGGGL